MYFVHTPFSYDLLVVPSSSQASPLPELLLTELLEFVCVPLLLATDVPPELEPAVVADELLMAALEELSAVCGLVPSLSPPQEVIARAAQNAAGIRNSFLIAKPLIQRQIYS